MLKLDATFFGGSDNKEKENLIVRSIITMAKELDIKVVAEGIEKQEQVEFLMGTGCDLIQGFVYFKPMPIKEFEKCINVQNETQPENPLYYLKICDIMTGKRRDTAWDSIR